MRPVPTRSPSVRSARPNEVRRSTGSVSEQGLLGTPAILAILDGPAERVTGRLARSRIGSHERERTRPVDRLGRTGRFHEVERTQALDRLGDGAGERLRYLRRPQPHDRDLALQVGKLDPVVEATP